MRGRGVAVVGVSHVWGERDVAARGGEWSDVRCAEFGDVAKTEEKDPIS
jgi:hypothetical protein